MARADRKTWPDGSVTVHIVAVFVPEDPSIATERLARTEFHELDGSVTIKGLAIRLSREGERIIIRDAGWVRFLDEGVVAGGPHPFLEIDPAEVFC